MAKSQTHQQMLVLKNFSKKAAGMRKHFSDVFKSAGHESRFKWDLWDVPGQYHLLRSPATHFFPKNLIDPWMEELVLARHMAMFSLVQLEETLVLGQRHHLLS